MPLAPGPVRPGITIGDEGDKATMDAGRIVKVSGPLIVAEGMVEAKMFEVARVSDRKLIGEIIELHGDQAYIQVSARRCARPVCR